jgi:hypothetical protein
MLQYAAGVALLVAIGAMTIGFTGERRGKRAQYYAIRRMAHEKSNRRIAFGFWSLVFAGLLLGLSTLLPQDFAANEAGPVALDTAAPLAPTTSTTTSTTELVPAVTELPSTPITLPAMATPLPTAAPSATPAESVATPTLAVATTAPEASTRNAALLTAIPTAVMNSGAGTPLSPSTSQALALRAIGTGWGKAGELQGVATEFTTGTKTITVFFNFQNVPKGSLLRHTWLRDGKTLSFSSATFSKPGKGTEAISWSPRDGFAPGLYEVRVALGSAQQFVANFLVR